MKLITIFGASLLTFCGILTFSNHVSALATTPENIIESTKPSLNDLNDAISRIENLENYHQYSKLSSDDLKTTTKFYREYTYLFNIVAKANELQINYATADTKELIDIIAAAKDAEIACGYLFGTVYKNFLSNSNNSSVGQNEQPPISSPKPTPIATTTAKSPTKPLTPNPTVTSAPQISETSTLGDPTIPSDNKINSDEHIDISIPDTGETTKNHKPLFITIATAALACFFIGSMIILNRKKPYRPGRKF